MGWYIVGTLKPEEDIKELEEPLQSMYAFYDEHTDVYIVLIDYNEDDAFTRAYQRFLPSEVVSLVGMSPLSEIMEV